MKNYTINKNNILILGITGQDGSLLAQYYLKKNFKVFGYLTTKNKSFRNLKKLKILNKVQLISYKKKSIEKVISVTKCKYIFFLAGISSVVKGNLQKHKVILSNNLLLIKILEFLRKSNNKKIKILNASSSEIFGSNKDRNSEESKINPVSYYGLAKSISTEIARAYRSQFGLKIFNAILFNHESPIRHKDYVIQKIITNAKSIYLKKINKIYVGNLDVIRDWGWAPEYVKIMDKIINLKKSDDFIVATGKNNKLKKVIKYIFSYYNLDYKKFIIKSKKFERRYEVIKISGNNKKLTQTINYQPKILIKEIVNKMILKKF
jgi:GDPmannose 4,6-dehydratase